MSRKVQVYKVFRRIAGTLFSAIVDGPCRIEYSKKDKYDLVFAFVDYDKAMEFAKPLSCGGLFCTPEIWLCSAEKVFVPKYILADSCAQCCRWPKRVLKRVFTGENLKEQAVHNQGFCIFCAKADRPGVACVVPLSKSLEGRVVCEGLRLVKKIKEVE